MFDNPLVLQKEMEGTWLIQRLQKPRQMKLPGGKSVDNPFSFGGGLKNGGLSDEAMGLLRGIISFDYMGSSEFEWGAVPNALRFLAQQSSSGNIDTGHVICGKVPVYYITPKQYAFTVRKRIQKLYADEYKNFDLKESCGLRRSIEGENEWDKKNVGWLELDNGFAFFTDKDMFQKFAKLFGIDI